MRSSAPAHTDSVIARRLPFSPSIYRSSGATATMGAGRNASNADGSGGMTLRDDSGDMSVLPRSNSNVATGTSDLNESEYMPRSQITFSSPLQAQRVNIRSIGNDSFVHGPLSDVVGADFAETSRAVNNANAQFNTERQSQPAFSLPTLDTVCCPASLANYALTSTASPSPPLVPTIDNLSPCSPNEWQGGSLGSSCEWGMSYCSWESRRVFTVASSSKLPFAPRASDQTMPLSPPSDQGTFNPAWSTEPVSAGQQRLVSPILGPLARPSWRNDESLLGPHNSLEANYSRSLWPEDNLANTNSAPLISCQATATNEDCSTTQLTPTSPESCFYPRLSGPEAAQSLSESLQTSTSIRDYPGGIDGHISNHYETVLPRYCQPKLAFDNRAHSFRNPCLAPTDPPALVSGGPRNSFSDPCGNLGVASSTDQSDGERT